MNILQFFSNLFSMTASAFIIIIMCNVIRIYDNIFNHSPVDIEVGSFFFPLYNQCHEFFSSFLFLWDQFPEVALLEGENLFKSCCQVYS